MPIYAYKCPCCGASFDRLLPLARYNEPVDCVCGTVAEKQLNAPAVFADYAGYSCPITGDWIEGRKAHEANLAKHNCRVLEPGETEAAKRFATSRDDTLAEKIADTAASLVESMPAVKREQLGRELSNGADVTMERS